MAADPGYNGISWGLSGSAPQGVPRGPQGLGMWTVGSVPWFGRMGWDRGCTGAWQMWPAKRGARGKSSSDGNWEQGAWEGDGGSMEVVAWGLRAGAHDRVTQEMSRMARKQRQRPGEGEYVMKGGKAGGQQ